jgi:phosphatidylserine/phosphatidylglycerophosphate/cardiolipin synthase-like enzyme
MKLAIKSLTALYRKQQRVILFSLLIVLGFWLVYNFRPTPRLESLKPLPQDPAIKVYFNQNQAATYEDPYRHFKRKGDNLEQQIINAISQAESTVDLAIMEFRLPNVAKALIAKQSRGVKVRLLIDNNYNKTLADYTSAEIANMSRHNKAALAELKRYPADALAWLRESGIEIKDDTSDGATKGSGLMHHKFIIIDTKTTIISSGNLTTSDLNGDFSSLESRGNPNNLVVITNNTEVAQAFTDEFNYMWQGVFKSHKPYRPPLTTSVGSGTITINFSPAPKKQAIETTSNGIISFYLQQTNTSAHIALFVYSAQTISDTLGEVRERGVTDIKVLVDPDFYKQPYSKAYDALGVCPTPGKGKRKSKIQVNPWRNPIATVGFPVAPAGDRGVHSKMAIVDGSLTITGSHNWSNAGNYSNDETLIAIDNPIVAAHYEREFSRLYKTAILGKASLPHARECGSDLTPTLPTPPTEVEPLFPDD